MRKLQFPAGTIIFSEGDTSKEIYILNKGIIDVLTGENIVARISQRGTFFGEMAAILKEERNATLRAQTDCTCIVLYEKYIDAIIKSAPEIGFNLVRILARRLKQTTKQLSSFLEANQGKKDGFKNPYELMVALGMVSKGELSKAAIAMKEEDSSRPFFHYLRNVSNATEDDLRMALQLYKKYHS